MKRLSLACLFALAPLAASANIIPTNTSITGSGPFLWTYNLQLSDDQDVQSGLPPSSPSVPHDNLSFGSFLTIYDFGGYVAGSCGGPTGWTCTAQAMGYTPDDTLPSDDATLMNLTWVYTSGATINGTPGNVDLGSFFAQSIYDSVHLVSYTARGVKNRGASAGTIADNVGSVAAPMALNVPEPGSLALAGLGLMAAVTSLRRRAQPGQQKQR
jgi:hypothetical protein